MKLDNNEVHIIDRSVSNGVATIKIESTGAGDKLTLVFMSDEHLDSIYCMRKAWKEDMEFAKSQGALIFLGGDEFDAMQRRFDPRSSLKELRPEYRRDDYLDFVVQDVASLMAPYAENIVFIGMGNHEYSVLRNTQTNLTDRLAFHLNALHGGHVQVGGLMGWIRLLFIREGHNRGALRIRFAHTSGGGKAVVSRGMIGTNRQAVYLANADIVWNGHNHQEFVSNIARERLTDRGQVVFDMMKFIRTPGYKFEWWGEKQSNYASLKQVDSGPTLVGCVVCTVEDTGHSTMRLGCSDEHIRPVPIPET